MILRLDPLPEPESRERVSAWEAVAHTQKVSAHSYNLVRQPDHARLAGELAARFSFPGMPPMTDEIIRGITLHDEGWADFDCGRKQLQATPAQYLNAMPLSAEGKPLSFLDIKAVDFLEAWRGSIAAAEEVAPIAGLIVSGHFYRLGQFGVKSGHYSGGDAQLISGFLSEEDGRRGRLMKHETRAPAQVEYWTDLLQFCDLLSLYLCCGSRDSVEFPQTIAGGQRKVTVQLSDGWNVTSPPLFAAPTGFSLYAYAITNQAPVPLQWTLR